MGGEWLKRPYCQATDEDALVYLWAKSYAHSRYGRNYTVHLEDGSVSIGADRDKSPAELAYWAEQAPLIDLLLKNADTEVICDPERAYPIVDVGLDGKMTRLSNGQPLQFPVNIWAYACTSGDVIHYCGIKRSVIKILGREMSAEIIEDLLGDRLRRACRYTYEPVELWAAGAPVRAPREWYPDTTWWGRAFVPPRRAA